MEGWGCIIIHNTSATSRSWSISLKVGSWDFEKKIWTDTERGMEGGGRDRESIGGSRGGDGKEGDYLFPLNFPFNVEKKIKL